MNSIGVLLREQWFACVHGDSYVDLQSFARITELCCNRAAGIDNLFSYTWLDNFQVPDFEDSTRLCLSAAVEVLSSA